MTANIIAIDGPAGAGKSTVAKLIAKKLGYTYIDTGAMYRVCALLAIQNGIAFDDEAGLGKIASSVSINLGESNGQYKVFCNGKDVSLAIRTPEVSAAASPVSAVYSVRVALVEQQREMAQLGGVVMDGRDIGTNVFPNADCKIYLTATPEERARRRYLEFMTKGYDITPEKVLQELNERDYRDSNREYAPLKKAFDAYLLDSTDLTIEEVVEQIVFIANGVNKR